MTAPPRVLVCARPAVGGAARVIDALLRRLPERGIGGTAALSGIEGDALLEVAAAHGWDTVRLDLRREISPVRDAAAGLKLRRLARGHDIVHAHAAKAGALARVALPLRKGVPVIYTPHGFYFTYHDENSTAWKRYLGLEQRLAPRTTMLHCVSDAERDVAVEYGLATEEGCHVLPNPLPPACGDDAILLPEFDPARPLVVMVARLSEPKDPVTYVRAAQRLASTTGARFVLVGEGPLRADIAVADPDGVVTLMPAETRVRELLRRAAVAVLATGSEALPLYLVEVLAEGVPAVATDVAGCRAASGDAALFVPPRDPDALAAAIGRLLQDGAERERLITAARERAPLFDEDRWADGLAAMYDRVLHRSAGQ